MVIRGFDKKQATTFTVPCGQHPDQPQAHQGS